MNETVSTVAAAATDALVRRQLSFVGAAYLVILAMIFAYVWRLGSATRRLASRLDEVERELGDR